jgi:7-carboxy-7-deazaguanine synthase
MISLRITEIFYSLQGETRTAGLPTVFVRLTGCPLRCQYCDTAYAFQGGQSMSLPDILTQVAHYTPHRDVQVSWEAGCRERPPHRDVPPRYVTVTGGEPLAQKNCLVLLTALCDAGYEVSLETSGALDISAVDARVSKIVDIKTPASDESDKNMYGNIGHITARDHIKFVLCSREDYLWAKDIMARYNLPARCEILFSPSHQQISATVLADWILQDRLPVRLQIQLHKYLWGNTPGK